MVDGATISMTCVTTTQMESSQKFPQHLQRQLEKNRGSIRGRSSRSLRSSSQQPSPKPRMDKSIRSKSQSKLVLEDDKLSKRIIKAFSSLRISSKSKRRSIVMESDDEDDNDLILQFEYKGSESESTEKRDLSNFMWLKRQGTEEENEDILFELGSSDDIMNSSMTLASPRTRIRAMMREMGEK